MTAVLASLVLFPIVQSHVMTPYEAKIGFRPLFDGQTTTGWKAWRGTGVPKAWEAENFELVLRPGSGAGGDLCSVTQFADFDLRLEWKIAKGGNSGIIYRAAKDYPESWKTGPEYQVLDDYAAFGGRPADTSAASLYDMIAPPMMVSKPAGEWNETRIVVRGNHIAHWFNHVKVVDCVVGSPDWNARIERSKFKEFPEYARKTRGYIVLQDHGAQVAYRRIRIKEL